MCRWHWLHTAAVKGDRHNPSTLFPTFPHSKWQSRCKKFEFEVGHRLWNMADNWNLRWEISGFIEVIKDCISVLNHHLERNNFVDGGAVTNLMKELNGMSLSRLNDAVEDAERSQMITDILLKMLKILRIKSRSSEHIQTFYNQLGWAESDRAVW